MAKDPNKTGEIPYAEYEEVETGKETQKEVVDRVSEKPRKDTEVVLTSGGLQELSELKPEQIAKIQELKSSINIEDVNTIAEYGAQEQSGIVQALEEIGGKRKTRDIDVIGKDITDLRSLLRSKGKKETGSKVMSLVRKMKEMFLSKRDESLSLEENIEGIEKVIKGHIKLLGDDIKSLDKLREINKDRFYELELLRRALLEKIKEMNDEIEKKRHEYEESDGKLDDMEQQMLAKMAYSVELLQKKYSDLHTSQVLAVQTAAQIHMIKCNDMKLKELMQETILTSIPIWRMQGALTVATQDAQVVANMHNAISTTTNEMLQKNAEMLGTLSKSVATEAEKPVVETETLEKVFITISDTLRDVARIAEEGQRQRIAGEKKLMELESKMVASQFRQIEGPKKKGK